MASSITTYYCDRCHSAFRSLSEAENCESKHHDPISIKSFSHSNTNSNKYPDTINIAFENTTITYYRKGAKYGI